MAYLKTKSKREIVFYVSTAGNNVWSGMQPEPAGDNGPFATVVRARDAIRALNRRAMPVHVFIRGGVYELPETLVFTPQDSGTERCPVTYCAYPGEKPVLSGGRRIAGWQKGTVNGRECWKTALPDKAWYFTQLFVNGERRFRPRLPKQGAYHFASIPARGGVNDWGHGPDGAFFKPGEIVNWKNAADIKIMALQNWFEMHHRIKDVDVDKAFVRFRAESLGCLTDEKGDPARYWVENVFEALDTPGEWYLDRSAGQLYYIPLASETLEETEVVAPRLETLVRIAGTDRAPAAFIRFENIAFRHADWDYPVDDCGSVQAAFKVPGALIFDRAEHCALYGCSISHVAQYGVEMVTGCHRNRVIACAIFDTGAGGVKIWHEWLTLVNTTLPAAIKPRRSPKPMAATVSDCTIHDGGRIHLSAIGILVGNAGGNRIVHNHIHDYNYTGISCGWTWSYEPTATHDNRIEYNQIHHINWNEILSDNGGIYTLGIHDGATVRGNHIHHVSCYGYGGWGIYADEGSSEIIYENNLVHHTKNAAFNCHYGRDLLVRNNLFVLSQDAHLIAVTRLEEHRTMVFERNILTWREGLLHSTGYPTRGWPVRMRDNLFWAEGGGLELGPAKIAGALPITESCADMFVADPLLADPESDDFTLRADSPARRLGFKPFDWEKAGPRLAGRHPLCLDDWPAEIEKPRAIVRSRLEFRKGLVRLTLENVGSAPASGALRLKAHPAAEIGIEGQADFAFHSLKPGMKTTADFRLRRREAEGRCWVETVPLRGEGLLPTLSLQTGLLRWSLPRIAPLSGAEAVAAALAGFTPRADPFFDLQTAAVRLAMADEYLALHAVVTDSDLKQTKLAWQGSAVILCGCAEPSPANTAGAAISQIFLVPAAGDKAAYAARQDGPEQKPAPEISLISVPTAKGYALSALVPLKLFNIAPQAETFRLEVQVATTLLKARSVRVALCNAKSPHVDASGHARVRVR